MENARCSTFLASARVYRPSDRVSRYTPILLSYAPTPSLLSPYCTRFRHESTVHCSPIYQPTPPRVIDYRCLHGACVVFFVVLISVGRIANGDSALRASRYTILPSQFCISISQDGYLIPRCFYRQSHSRGVVHVERARNIPREGISRGGEEHRFLECSNARRHLVSSNE